MKLLITGVHMAPALAVIDTLLAQPSAKPTEIIYVGRKYLSSSTHLHTLEYEEIRKRNLPFYDLGAVRLQVRRLPRSVIGFLHSVRVAYRLLQDTKPDAILTFGSYVAVPVALAGWILRIPIDVHEQTIRPGLSTQFIAHLARHVYVSFEETVRYFDRRKTMVTGNPVRPGIQNIQKIPFEIMKTKPTILILGGSTGSHSINVLIERILPQLLERFIVIHQTGNHTDYADDVRLAALRKTFPEDLKNRYIVRPYFLTDEMGFLYDQADLIVCRSGANTFFDLISWEKPAVLIPLPWSAHAEQERHAVIIENAGAGVVFHQDSPPELLLEDINTVFTQRKKMKEGFASLKSYLRPDAASRILYPLYAMQEQ